jgi:hypothetical protein
MNIKKTLSAHNYSKYGISRVDVYKILNSQNGFKGKKSYALATIAKIMKKHDKEPMLLTLVDLAKVENGMRIIEKRSRDHVLHAMFTYILGIYIYDKYYYKFRKITPLQWKIAGLFHDIGYLLEYSFYICKYFTDTMNNIRSETKIKGKKVQCQIIPKYFEMLQNGNNAINLIQSTINTWGLAVDAKKEYANAKNNKMNHGIIGAIAILNIIDGLYQKNNPKRLKRNVLLSDNTNWNQTIFDRQIVPACTAIFLHGLDIDRFNDKKINYKKAPIAFLLKLTDELQDWQRPTNKLPRGHKIDNYRIFIENKKIKYYIKKSLKRTKNIRDNIYSTLDADNIVVDDF